MRGYHERVSGAYLIDLNRIYLTVVQKSLMITDVAETAAIDDACILSVTERDIDLLILEEFHSNPDFTAWFVKYCFPQAEKVEFCGAWHSLVDSVYGESDLTLVVDVDGQRTAILIEDKIDAITMPEQANRYRRRGDKGILDDRWQRFLTCMIAPERYLERLPEEESYEAYLSYEDIAAWFKAAESSFVTNERGVYRSTFINSAIEKQRRTGAAPRDPFVEAFLSRYLEYIQQNHPSLPRPLINGNWATINLVPLAEDIGVSIHHKLTQGLVELEFKCSREDHADLMRRFADLQNPNRIFQRYSKYLGLREDVDRLDIGADFESALPSVSSALVIAETLFSDFRRLL